ncbi:hemerythrin domain-containing protein [Nocardioides ferulae]|uniref:hemerythrin domain-containing protein n=1 Tax=Nocardioides ferulae TaxID=2340821 RepID=UPI000EB5AF8D|nr:hemerythrin domain-containing protein [Nocardioides ferulae]
MCEHCGCRGVEPIAQLMDEHFELLEISDRILAPLAVGDHAATLELLAQLREILVPHGTREERGIFAALRAQGEFVEAVDELEGEHASFEAMLDTLDPASPTFVADVKRLLAELAEHIDQENLGIFPVAVVTLTNTGWDTVAEAHACDHTHAHSHA